ncbi:hypothetical protein HD806DRAFT_507376, partial [Xylariaceae sp. AK1471]
MHVAGPPLTPEPSILRHTMAPPRDLDVPRSQQHVENARLPSPQRYSVPGGPYCSPKSSPLASQAQGIPSLPPDRSRMILRRRKQLPWTPPSSVKKYRHIDDSQISPANLQRGNDFKQTQISFGSTQASRRQHGARGGVPKAHFRSHGSPDELEAEGTVNLQDMFSTARHNLHYQLSQMEDNLLVKAAEERDIRGYSQQPSSQRQPFSVLQTNTIMNSQGPRENREPTATTLPTGDPRAYLLRRQKSMAAEESGTKPKRLRRLKSCLMPLENIPPEYQTRSLSLAMSMERPILDEIVGSLRKYDEYVIYGTLVDGLDMSLADGCEIESRLQDLLDQQKENIGDRGSGNNEVIIDLQATRKDKSVVNDLAT